MEKTDQTSTLNHTMDARRLAKEQGQRLDQAAAALEALCTPALQIWAGQLTLIGDSISAWGTMINKWASQQQAHY